MKNIAKVIRARLCSVLPYRLTQQIFEYTSALYAWSPYDEGLGSYFICDTIATVSPDKQDISYVSFSYQIL